MTKLLNLSEQYLQISVESSLRGASRQSRERHGNLDLDGRLPRFADAYAIASADKSLARNEECCLLNGGRLSEQVIVHKGGFHA